MDMPAQQFHINSCLDRQSSGGEASFAQEQVGMSGSKDIAAWLGNLGMARYTPKFLQVGL